MSFFVLCRVMDSHESVRGSARGSARGSVRAAAFPSAALFQELQARKQKLLQTRDGDSGASAPDHPRILRRAPACQAQAYSKSTNSEGYCSSSTNFRGAGRTWKPTWRAASHSEEHRARRCSSSRGDIGIVGLSDSAELERHVERDRAQCADAGDAAAQGASGTDSAECADTRDGDFGGVQSEAAVATHDGANAPLSADLNVIELSKSQRQALEAVRSGKNVFIQGPAGTGKSLMLRAVERLWRDESEALNAAAEVAESETACSGAGAGASGRKRPRPRARSAAAPAHYSVTATTGIAAVNLGLGARTLYSVMGWHASITAERTPTALATEVLMSPRLAFRRRQVAALRHLVIDEASMLAAPDLDFLDTYLTVARRQPRAPDGTLKPFGGVQVVLVGDVCQLPPIAQRGSGGGGGGDADARPAPAHVFKAAVFARGGFRVCALREVFRQSDAHFIALLQRARFGESTDEDIDVLNSRVGADVSVGGVQPSTLYCFNSRVDAENAARLAALPGERHVFPARAATHLNADSRRAPPVVQNGRLAALARLVNEVVKGMKLGAASAAAGGSAGCSHPAPRAVSVASCLDAATRVAAPALAALPEVTLAVGAQVVLSVNLAVDRKLGNGSRGVVSGFETPAQWNARHAAAGHAGARVALDPRGALTAPATLGAAPAAYVDEALPVVRFIVPRDDDEADAGTDCAVAASASAAAGNDGQRAAIAASGKFQEIEVLVPYWRFRRSDAECGEAVVAQVPLRLAWATTVHSSQSQSLALVRVALDGVFDPGQAYVALSRCRSLGGLSLSSPVCKASLFADPECVAFSKAVEGRHC